MIIAVASGKGGTGKTTFAVNLAYALAGRAQNAPGSARHRIRLLDCDVEEPNDHLFVRPDYTDEKPVIVSRPRWEPDRCTACGRCAEACQYNALAVVKGKLLIFDELCHSCGVCMYVCPTDALSEGEAVIGKVQMALGQPPFCFAHGLLNIGEALAPKVVKAVKEELEPDGITIIDAAPGTSCPVVAAIEGANVVLLVTEPTPFGLHDLKLAVAMTLSMRLPTAIIVNRSDGEDRIIAEYARQIGLPIAGRIPFRRDYAEVYADGGILIDHFPELRENLLHIFDHLEGALPPQPATAARALATGRPAIFTKATADRHQEIAVISGKGGTGKTTVMASLARLAEQAILADNDVDAADLHLLLSPTVHERHDFVGGNVARIDPSSCFSCGKCAKACHFHAIAFDGPATELVARTFLIDPLACEGCGMCALVCPVGAITSEPRVAGEWYVSVTDCGPMVHACLGIAEENSGRLVEQVRRRAGELATELGQSLILGDGPPGTGCPVIASVTGTDLIVIVTEPTVSGVHDMERVIRLAAHFRIPAAIVINKADLHAGQARRIEAMAAAYDTPIIGRIPFDREVNEALMAGKTVIDYSDGRAATAIHELWRNFCQLLNRTSAERIAAGSHT